MERLKNPDFSLLFYISNICGVAFGVYLVIAHSILRILVVYCLFNFILFWIATDNRKTLWTGSVWNPRQVLSCLAISAAALLSILVVTSSESLYARPTFLPPMIAMTIVLVTIIAVEGGTIRERPFFMKTWFLLPVLISLVLLVEFSTYLVQPNVLAEPTYATVDAYRDYINAARILIASGVHAEDMVFQRYYAAFPVVPLQASAIGLITGLPINGAHMILAVLLETIGVVCVWLLSSAVVREVEPAMAPSAGVLATVLVLLQPYLIDPSSLLAPIRLSIPIVSLVLYLTYRNLIMSGPRHRSVLVSIFILTLVIIPMHAVSSMFLIVSFLAIGFFVRQSRGPATSLAMITVLFFVAYLISLAATPLSSLLFFARTTYAALVEILSGGPSNFALVVLGSRISAQQTEFELFTQALPMALVLSISTTCIAGFLRASGQDSKSRRLSALHAIYGALAMAGIGAGFVLSFFRVDMRYFAFPVTGMLVIACAAVLGYAWRNVSTSRMKGSILIGLIALYALSMTSSPLIFQETSPGYVRWLPTESESAAALFLAGNVRVENGSPVQVITDWPFYSHVMGLVYSSGIGIEDKVKFVGPISYFPEKDKQTIVILRQYFLESLSLRSINRARILQDADTLNSYNRISDSGTACVYIGRFTG